MAGYVERAPVAANRVVAGRRRVAKEQGAGWVVRAFLAGVISVYAAIGLAIYLAVGWLSQ